MAEEVLEGQRHDFNPVEVSAPHIIYVAVGFFIVVFGMFSMLFKERLYLGEAPLALVFGIIIGPSAAAIFHPNTWGGQPEQAPGSETTREITLEVMRVCISLSVFSVGVELPKKYVWRHWRSISMLLGPVMLWGWLITGLLIWALIPETILYEIVLGTLIGVIIGYLARKLIRFSERYKLVDRESFVAQYLSLALASMGVNVLIGSDDLLAAFACGTAFAWDGWFQKQTADSNFSSIVDLIFNIATFIYIGAEMPWKQFTNSDQNLSVGRLIGLSILVLLLKRIPIVVALWKFIPDIKTFHEALFSGYFGPIGVGAIFMCTYGRLLLPEKVPIPPETPNDVLSVTIQPIVYFFVLASVIVHGFTIPFFAFGKKAHVNLNRTFTQNFSTMGSDANWMDRVRRFNTTATTTMPEPNHGQLSVVQAMREGLERRKRQGLPIDENVEREVNAQLASATKSSEAVQRPESEFPRTMTVDDIEDVQISGGGDWDGEDTAEARRQREKTHLSSVEEQDIVDTHRQDDFDLEGQIFEKDNNEADSKYPRIDEWIEGHNIVVNITEKELDEPETIVIPIHPDDYEAIKESQSPLRLFISKYEDKLSDRLAWNEKRKLSDLTMREIQQKNLMKKIAHMAHTFERRLHKGHKHTEDNRESIYPELEVVRVHPNGQIVDS